MQISREITSCIYVMITNYYASFCLLQSCRCTTITIYVFRVNTFTTTSSKKGVMQSFSKLSSKIRTMLGTKLQVSFSNNKHFVIGCQVCQPIREEEIKTLLFSDWFTDLTTNHKVFVFRKRDLMFRTKHGRRGLSHMQNLNYDFY